MDKMTSKIIKKYNKLIPKDKAHSIAVTICAYLENNELLSEEEIKEVIDYL